MRTVCRKDRWLPILAMGGMGVLIAATPAIAQRRDRHESVFESAGRSSSGQWVNPRGPGGQGPTKGPTGQDWVNFGTGVLNGILKNQSGRSIRQPPRPPVWQPPRPPWQPPRPVWQPPPVKVYRVPYPVVPNVHVYRPPTQTYVRRPPTARNPIPRVKAPVRNNLPPPKAKPSRPKRPATRNRKPAGAEKLKTLTKAESFALTDSLTTKENEVSKQARDDMEDMKVPGDADVNKLVEAIKDDLEDGKTVEEMKRQFKDLEETLKAKAEQAAKAGDVAGEAEHRKAVEKLKETRRDLVFRDKLNELKEAVAEMGSGPAGAGSEATGGSSGPVGGGAGPVAGGSGWGGDPGSFASGSGWGGDPGPFAGGFPGSAGIPSGLIDVWNYPGLPAESLYRVNDRMMVAGTGGVGSLSYYETTPADLLGYSEVAGMPVPDAGSGSVAGSVAGTVIRSPKDLAATLHYTLNGHAFSIQPGYSQKLDAGRSWVVEFDRGGSFGRARYSLTGGTYEFAATDRRGWDLVKQTFRVTIDNTGNKDPFHYNVDNRPAVVAGGRTREHTSGLPILVAFDRGDGGEPAQKKLTQSGIYKIGVSPATGLWDMFPGEAASAVASGWLDPPRPDADS